MKRWTWTLGILFAAGMATAMAQQPPGGRGDRRDRGGPPDGPPPSPIMEVLDANHDHVISAEEIKNASAALLALDKNKDGKLTEDEFRPGAGRGRGGGRPGAGPPGGGPDRGPPGGREGFGPPSNDRGGPNDRGGAEGRRPEGRFPPDEDHGRPVEQIAKELGVTLEKFREAFKKVNPAPRGEQPTEAQRQANRKTLSDELGVSPEKLDAVMDKYRPEGRTSGPGGRGPGDRGPEGRGPEGRGPEGREPGGPDGPPPPNSERFVEDAMEFDADKDGKLSKDELKKFAEEMGRRRGNPPPRRGGPDGPPGGDRPGAGERPERPRSPE